MNFSPDTQVPVTPKPERSKTVRKPDTTRGTPTFRMIEHKPAPRGPEKSESAEANAILQRLRRGIRDTEHPVSLGDVQADLRRFFDSRENVSEKQLDELRDALQTLLYEYQARIEKVPTLRGVGSGEKRNAIQQFESQRERLEQILAELMGSDNPNQARKDAREAYGNYVDWGKEQQITRLESRKRKLQKQHDALLDEEFNLQNQIASITGRALGNSAQEIRENLKLTLWQRLKEYMTAFTGKESVNDLVAALDTVQKHRVQVQELIDEVDSQLQEPIERSLARAKADDTIEENKGRTLEEMEEEYGLVSETPKITTGEGELSPEQFHAIYDSEEATPEITTGETVEATEEENEAIKNNGVEILKARSKKKPKTLRSPKTEPAPLAASVTTAEEEEASVFEQTLAKTNKDIKSEPEPRVFRIDEALEEQLTLARAGRDELLGKKDKNSKRMLADYEKGIAEIEAKIQAKREDLAQEISDEHFQQNPEELESYLEIAESEIERKIADKADRPEYAALIEKREKKAVDTVFRIEELKKKYVALLRKAYAKDELVKILEEEYSAKISKAASEDKKVLEKERSAKIAAAKAAAEDIMKEFDKELDLAADAAAGFEEPKDVVEFEEEPETPTLRRNKLAENKRKKAQEQALAREIEETMVEEKEKPAEAPQPVLSKEEKERLFEEMDRQLEEAKGMESLVAFDLKRPGVDPEGLLTANMNRPEVFAKLKEYAQARTAYLTALKGWLEQIKKIQDMRHEIYKAKNTEGNQKYKNLGETLHGFRMKINKANWNMDSLLKEARALASKSEDVDVDVSDLEGYEDVDVSELQPPAETFQPPKAKEMTPPSERVILKQKTIETLKVAKEEQEDNYSFLREELQGRLKNFLKLKERIDLNFDIDEYFSLAKKRDRQSGEQRRKTEARIESLNAKLRSAGILADNEDLSVTSSGHAGGLSFATSRQRMDLTRHGGLPSNFDYSSPRERVQRIKTPLNTKDYGLTVTYEQERSEAEKTIDFAKERLGSMAATEWNRVAGLLTSESEAKAKELEPRRTAIRGIIDGLVKQTEGLEDLVDAVYKDKKFSSSPEASLYVILKALSASSQEADEKKVIDAAITSIDNEIKAWAPSSQDRKSAMQERIETSRQKRKERQERATLFGRLFGSTESHEFDAIGHNINRLLDAQKAGDSATMVDSINAIREDLTKLDKKKVGTRKRIEKFIGDIEESMVESSWTPPVEKSA